MIINLDMFGAGGGGSTTQYPDWAAYDSTEHKIFFKNGGSTGEVLTDLTIDCTPFIVDGFVDSVSIKTIDNVKYLAIVWNTDAGKSEVDIPLSDIFDASLYYDKTQIDAKVAEINSNMVDNEFVTAQALSVLNDNKQDKIVAGSNISIAADGKTISATNTTYSAGTNVQINGTTISATNTTYSAGSNITIDTNNNNAISADLSNYYTKSEIDATIGDINTILQSI